MKAGRSVGQFALIAIILGLFGLTVAPVITPVILGLLTALVADPLSKSLEKRLHIKPRFSAFLLTVFITIVFVLPIVLIAITVIQQLTEFIPSLEASDFISRYESLLEYIPIPRVLIESNLKVLMTQVGSGLTKQVTSFLASIPELIVGLMFYILALYYGLADGKRLSQFLWDSMPFERREISTLADTTEKICRGVVVGSLLAGAIQGSIIGITFACLGVPGALLFGTITAILSFVPAIGSGPTGVGGIIYLWAHGNTSGAIIMLIAFGIASTSDNIVKPWVLKGETELHPLLGLMSALGGLAVFGFAGLFLGPLFAALAVVILEFLQQERLESA